MFRELNAHMHENDLLIIDNVDDDTQEYWDSVVHEETVQGQTDLFTRLCQLNCKVLFMTRLDVSNVTGIVPFEVDRLELESLRAILRAAETKIVLLSTHEELSLPCRSIEL